MKAVLFDRDGTLIVEPFDDRVDRENKIKLFPDTLQALKKLADNNIAIVIISNQAGIAEGRIDENRFKELNDIVVSQLKPSGITILKTYMCPHQAGDDCECRKPSPYMLQAAAKEFGINLTETYMVGDRLSDIEAGINAGTKTILVKTARVPVESEKATHTAANLNEAVEYILSH